MFYSFTMKSIGSGVLEMKHAARIAGECISSERRSFRAPSESLVLCNKTKRGIAFSSLALEGGRWEGLKNIKNS